MNLTKMKVGTRLGLGFTLVLFFLVIVTTIGIYSMSNIQTRLENIVNINNVQSRLMMDMRAVAYDRGVSLRNLTLLTEIDDMGPDLKRIEDQSKKYAELEDKLSQSFDANVSTTKEENEGLKNLKEGLKKLKEFRQAASALPEKAKELGLANNFEAATIAFIRKVRPAQNKWIDELDVLIAAQDKSNNEVAENARSAYSLAKNIMLGIGIVALILGFAAANIITRSLLKQLGGEPDYAAKIANHIASGDLSVPINTIPGDTNSLLVEMKTMRDSLVSIVGQVRTGTDTIETASKEIASGNLDLSNRTELQASSLEKTTSSMKELTITVKQNADSAREANKLAASASNVARQGGVVVAEVVGTMSDINESAKKIVDIISVIDGIAFQTNILALNAAVEAARAGEQGRGFAVVASEVRNLAQRSAAAAKEIKTLIGTSVEKVEIGSKLVAQAGATIEDVVNSVRHVTDIIAEISAASQDQSQGIAEVNQAIIEMDGMTQQNAALVEEAAAAAQSLQDQAAELASVVSIFKLDIQVEKMGTRNEPLSVKRVDSMSSKQKLAAKPKMKSLPVVKPVLKKSAKVDDSSDWEEF
jgi:methyl-accepting chemotaxis protein